MHPAWLAHASSVRLKIESGVLTCGRCSDRQVVSVVPFYMMWNACVLVVGIVCMCTGCRVLQSTAALRSYLGVLTLVVTVLGRRCCSQGVCKESWLHEVKAYRLEPLAC